MALMGARRNNGSRHDSVGSLSARDDFVVRERLKKDKMNDDDKTLT